MNELISRNSLIDEDKAGVVGVDGEIVVGVDGEVEYDPNGDFEGVDGVVIMTE